MESRSYLAPTQRKTPNYNKMQRAMFDSEFYSNLADDEAVVICDWKMKILSSKFREAQAEWFSKRGMSLLGFEIHLKSENEDERRVLYHFFCF